MTAITLIYGVSVRRVLKGFILEVMDYETFNIGTLYDCTKLYSYEESQRFEPLWTQTVLGCGIVILLQEMYRFNISYVIHPPNYTTVNLLKSFYSNANNSIDIYTRPMSLRLSLLESGFPVQPIYKWRFGFVLRRPEDNNYLQLFYSKPFTRPLWNSLYITAVIISIIFFLLQLWEKRVVGRVHENGITYEMLVVMGSYCQHIPPLHAVLSSRRAAYFVFLIFSYVIYAFYTSNLLSHLVNDRNEVRDLKTLSKHNYEYIIMNHAKILLEYNAPNNEKMNTWTKRLLGLENVTISDGLQRVKKGKSALLSDYTSLTPHMKSSFSVEELCKLICIDLFSNIKKYFFTSKNFTYKEQFKIGIQKMRESGILKRLLYDDLLPMRHCHPTKHFQTEIIQIFTPLTTLVCAYGLSLIILMGERYYFQRYRLFPFTN